MDNINNDPFFLALISPSIECMRNDATCQLIPNKPIGGRDFSVARSGYDHHADYIDYMECLCIGNQEI
jgi:hypothetical protein